MVRTCLVLNKWVLGITVLTYSFQVVAENAVEIPELSSFYNVSKGIILAADATQSPREANDDGQSSGSKIVIPTVNVNAQKFKQIGPLPGLALTRDEIAGNVQSLSAEQIHNAHALSLADLMNSQLQSVNVNDYQGNPFQMDVTYRGFTASPQLGTSQGLSVFLDGIRVNEPFGDVVNWDLIPMNAIAGLDVIPGSNPIFGLGTLGGAISVKTKNGFDNPGAEAEMLAGSFGRKQFLLSAGGSHDNFAGFVALNLFDEEGWRVNSPSKVNQVFTKLSYRNDALSLDGSMLYAGTKLTGNGVVPIEMYQQNSTSIFSGPDKTRNDLLQFQIAGAFEVSDKESVTAQIYNRRSDRVMHTADINQGFADPDNHQVATKATLGNTVTCAYSSTNPYHIADYYVAPDAYLDPKFAAWMANNPWMIANWTGVPGNGNIFTAFGINGPVGSDSYDYLVSLGAIGANGAFATGTTPDQLIAAGVISGTLNQTLPSNYAAAATAAEKGMFTGAGGQTMPIEYSQSNGGPLTAFYNGAAGGTPGVTQNFYTDATGNAQYLIAKSPLNATACLNNINNNQPLQDANGNWLYRNGAISQGFGQSNMAGYIPGTPIAIIGDTNIHQLVQGAGIQYNWNLDKHKLMVGTSIDHASDAYQGVQRLGFFDANRNAFLDPASMAAEFGAGYQPIVGAQFKGTSDTRSLYMSETYSPRENLHLSFSSRYNYATVSSAMSSRLQSALYSLEAYQLNWMDYILCAGSGLASCDQYLLTNPNTFNQPLSPTVSEKFKYISLNPAIGATWSPRENLNIYGNLSQGTRTPSTIELGCAFNPNLQIGPLTSITAQNPYLNTTSCQLPNVMSGDPYLKQVTAQTAEIGARGRLSNGWEWNASAYRSDLSNDIYFVSYTPSQSFFTNIGDTRRQGLEGGVSGKEGKLDFKVNLALTDATFQSNALVMNSSNISAVRGIETIQPGDVMPGIPKYNLNINLGYQMTEKWHVGLSMVAHSWAYERGNENNQEHPGTALYQQLQLPDPNTGQLTNVNLYKTYTTNGKTPGYAVVNFNTSYDFGKGWSANLLVNNLLNKTYYSAGSLGANPFSPSINGAIGVSGWNYNSNEWRYTDMVAPGAPRAAWVTLRYEFDPVKK
jgi:outer membrane receptor protein involved in Fe transport